jgi:hypothetical protein
MTTPQGPNDPRMPQQQQPPLGQPYAVRPGAPGYVPPALPYRPNPNEPDWSAMADAAAAARRRKRLWTVVLSVVGVVVLAGGGTAAYLAMSGGKPTPTPSPTTSSSGSTAPSHGPATPTQGSDLFTSTTLSVNGQTMVRKATAHQAPCWQATQGGLGTVLAKDHCTEALLATYVSAKDAVTVAVFVFPNADQAFAASSSFQGQVNPLMATGVPHFCVKVACAVTHAAQGPYVYTTIAGPVSGAAGAQDPDAQAAGHGIAGYALTRLTKQ